MSRSAIPYAERARRPVIVEGSIEVAEPVEGFYRMKLNSNGVLCGVRVWFGPPRDPDTGEELDRSWRWQAEVNGDLVEFDRAWPQCADAIITEEEYLQYIERQRWARENAPESAFADPRRRNNPLTSPLPF